jgi:predicted PurR-regulated permease PerM
MLAGEEDLRTKPEETAPAPAVPLRLVAGRVAVCTLVVLGIGTLAAALWVGRIVIALLFLAMVIAAAIRPSVEALRRWRVPRGIGVLLHYALFLGLVGLALWLVVPAAIDQVTHALGPEHGLRQEAQGTTGVKHDLLVALDRRLHDLPSGSELVDPAVQYGRAAFEIIIGTFFVFATAAYWILERERAIEVACSILPRGKRKTVRDTWELIDLKLGAFVRGQCVLIVIVGTVLSAAFWAIGLPYWLLVGVFAGIVEIVPVLGPLVAGLVAIGVGLSVSAHLAVLAGLLVLAVRLLEDYLIVPRVLGHSVGLSPLVVLVSVTFVGIVLGGYVVILAVPLASVVVTLIDVVVRDKDPAEEGAPSVIFPAGDSE